LELFLEREKLDKMIKKHRKMLIHKEKIYLLQILMMSSREGLRRHLKNSNQVTLKLWKPIKTSFNINWVLENFKGLVCHSLTSKLKLYHFRNFLLIWKTMKLICNKMFITYHTVAMALKEISKDLKIFTLALIVQKIKVFKIKFKWKLTPMKKKLRVLFIGSTYINIKEVVWWDLIWVLST
jgi:hypothetical protein